MQATRHRLREGEGQCKNADSENTIWKSLPVTEGFAIRTTADALIANQNRAIRVLNYPAAFLACALNLAHRLFVALLIFALAAADRTCFLTRVASRLAEFPKACAAARTRFRSCCNLPSCFSSFRSSRLIAARRSLVCDRQCDFL